MLQQVCEFLHNFDFQKGRKCYTGTYTIEGGFLPLSFVKDGQRFLICDSDLNDGLYTYHANGIRNDDDTEAAGLRDETFAGTICVLAVPPAVIALSGEIKEWVDTYGETINSPYQSETVIGVYSYEKASVGGTQQSTSKPMTWQTMFADRLNRWKRVAF